MRAIRVSDDRKHDLRRKRVRPQFVPLCDGNPVILHPRPRLRQLDGKIAGLEGYEVSRLFTPGVYDLHCLTRAYTERLG